MSSASSLHDLRSDPAATLSRYVRLADYMAANVLGEQGFCCTSERVCRGSVHPPKEFFAGQLSHVGRHYDLFRGGAPYRILVVGMDTGRNDVHVSLDERREQIYLVRDGKRNPHMRGTMLALRALLGHDNWERSERPEDEHLELHDESVHLFDAYAMANVRLCSAIVPRNSGSRGTCTMTGNCLRHLRATVEILEPKVVVLQSVKIMGQIKSLVEDVDQLTGNLYRARLAGQHVVLASFAHPSARGRYNWSHPASAYFTKTVLPTLRLAREMV